MSVYMIAVLANETRRSYLCSRWEGRPLWLRYRLETDSDGLAFWAPTDPMPTRRQPEPDVYPTLEQARAVLANLAARKSENFARSLAIIDCVTGDPVERAAEVRS